MERGGSRRALSDRAWGAKNHAVGRARSGAVPTGAKRDRGACAAVPQNCRRGHFIKVSLTIWSR